MKENSKKICLVTGASRGIGKEIAVALANTGGGILFMQQQGMQGTLRHGLGRKNTRQFKAVYSQSLWMSEIRRQSERCLHI